MGFRGAQWPFVLRARNDNEWKECAQRLISNCKLAVFDMRQRPGEGLNWEIEQATLLIGENQIARIENDDKGYVVLRVAGILHPPPPYIKDYALSEEEFKGQFETLCAIRSWVASSLPVFGRDLFFRQLFYHIDLVLSKITVMLLIIAPLLLLAGIIWAAKIMLTR